MTCEDAHLHMHDYISGELAPEYHKPLLDHMDECPNCKNFYIQTKQIMSTVRSAMQRKAPDELQSAVSNLISNA